MTGAAKWTDQGIVADLAFHKAVADATGNEYFSTFVGFIIERISHAINVARSKAILEEIVNITIEEHVSLRNAIASRNPLVARDAMRKHLMGAAARIGLALESY
ncbi:FCD domain protein [compost metagenome]